MKIRIKLRIKLLIYVKFQRVLMKVSHHRLGIG